MIIRLYGILADHVKTTQLEIPFMEDSSKVILYLESKFPGISVYSMRIAVNSVMIEKPTMLEEGDTVFLIPPFPGG